MGVGVCGCGCVGGCVHGCECVCVHLKSHHHLFSSAADMGKCGFRGGTFLGMPLTNDKVIQLHIHMYSVHVYMYSMCTLHMCTTCTWTVSL